MKILKKCDIFVNFLEKKFLKIFFSQKFGKNDFMEKNNW